MQFAKVEPTPELLQYLGAGLEEDQPSADVVTGSETNPECDDAPLLTAVTFRGVDKCSSMDPFLYIILPRMITCAKS